MQREAVDFHFIPVRQEAIHLRLLNWGRWCYSRPGASTQPMFRFYRSPEVWGNDGQSLPVDSLDAHRIEKGVVALPEKHGAAIRWHYVGKAGPLKFSKSIGVTQEALAELVIDGRNMLVNRKA
jgi:hypothetical protein